MTSLTPEQRHRVERGKPLVDQLARMLAQRLARVTEDELRSAGYEALVKCGLRYDPANGASFRTYSFHRVRGAMLDAARRSVPGLRQRSRALRTLQATQSMLEQAERRETSDGPETRTLQERVAVVAELVAQATAVVVLSQSIRDPEKVADDGSGDPEAVVLDVQLRDHVRHTLVRCCSEDERALLQALYDEGLTMTELGQRLGVNKSTISRRHATILRRLAEALRAPSDPELAVEATAGPSG